MYQCLYCSKSFDTSNKLSSHYARCNNHPKNKEEKICNFCGKSFYILCDYNRHINFCDKNPNKKCRKNPNESIKPIDGRCSFCGKAFNTINSLKGHERYCPSNPNAKKCPLKNRDWAKGLTRFTDERVARQSEGQKRFYQSNPGTGTDREWSKESKDKLIKYYNAYRGYFDGIMFMSGWELAYYIYMKDTGHSIERNKEWFSYVYNNKSHRYNPDFIVDNSIVVEVKGYETEIDKIKYTVVPNLLIVRKKDLLHMIDYVLRKFNTDNIKNVYEKRINC